MNEAYPWKVIVTNEIGKPPKLIIQNLLNNNYIRSEEVRRRIEHLITQSGREYINITFGILLTTTTNDYYLGIILNNPPFPIISPILPPGPIGNSNWISNNVHVVLVYINKEIECNIQSENIVGCRDNYAVTDITRFSLRVRTPPVVTNDCGVYVNGKSICNET